MCSPFCLSCANVLRQFRLYCMEKGLGWWMAVKIGIITQFQGNIEMKILISTIIIGLLPLSSHPF